MPSEAAAMFRVPSDYPTITAALAAAAPAQGTVVVAAGTYKEPGTLKLASGVSLEPPTDMPSSVRVDTTFGALHIGRFSCERKPDWS